jgi:hypothetical protein
MFSLSRSTCPAILITRLGVIALFSFDEKRAITSRWVIRLTSKFQGR